MTATMIKEHLYFHGMDKSCKIWQFEHEDNLDDIDDAYYESEVDPVKFEILLNDAEKPIYPGCTKLTKLSALLRLYNMKAKNGWTDKSFTELLIFLKDLLPEENEMPVSFYEAKKTMCSLDLQYEKRHVCPTDCHANERIKDGRLRHPADSPAWKIVDFEWPSFVNEPRNIRLALSTDEINPHTSLSNNRTPIKETIHDAFEMYFTERMKARKKINKHPARVMYFQPMFTSDKPYTTQEIDEVREEWVPKILTAGSKLENIIFEIVNCEGIVDDTIHDEEKTGLSHMLTIKADWLNLGESVRYTFKHGRCIGPAIPLSQIAGNYSFLAIHSPHSNLSLNVEVHVKPAIPNPKVEHDGKNFSTVIENNKKVFEEDLLKIGSVVRILEEKCVKLNEEKEKIEQTMKKLQDSTELYPFGLENQLSSKEEVMENIEKMGNSAAAVLCIISRGIPFQEPKNHLMKDTIGVVALLGRVQPHCSQLSRILSEYLGADQMLVVVVRSFETVVLLERYKQTGEVDRSHAIREEAAILDKSINGRFLVICFDNIR
ncbi:structural maintenance of chromosomes flexible hinge domain-containing protein GMI1-like [Humulus lupulus]|uniref:structural maintenance of chromosomes flexible hinge domain-containing protein GMI1-like n=1 Tax=Humulus lupulus TaxID=3486 RepID=UPI002B40341C|nr:structural maintenance of chromosomes flexible hinge domain-containing protein GMI1-like [Humulus lupulus]